jgi:hypothetical protein
MVSFVQCNGWFFGFYDRFCNLQFRALVFQKKLADQTYCSGTLFLPRYSNSLIFTRISVCSVVSSQIAVFMRFSIAFNIEMVDIVTWRKKPKSISGLAHYKTRKLRRSTIFWNKSKGNGNCFWNPSNCESTFGYKLTSVRRGKITEAAFMWLCI